MLPIGRPIQLGAFPMYRQAARPTRYNNAGMANSTTTVTTTSCSISAPLSDPAVAPSRQRRLCTKVGARFGLPSLGRLHWTCCCEIADAVVDHGKHSCGVLTHRPVHEGLDSCKARTTPKTARKRWVRRSQNQRSLVHSLRMAAQPSANLGFPVNAVAPSFAIGW